jgi:DNA polymerase-3 subunit epsilon
MSDLAKGSFTVFDTETTGTDPLEARVIELGFAVFDKGRCSMIGGSIMNPWPGFPEMCETLIDPEIHEITGITLPEIQEGVAFDRQEGIIQMMMGPSDFIVAYNAPYDVTVLRREAGRFGGMKRLTDILDSKPIVDPLPWVRQKDKYVKGKGKYKLANTCARYGINMSAAHRAQVDAQFTGELFMRLCAQGVIPDMPLDELVEEQEKLREQQDAEFQAYIEKKKLEQQK